MNSMIYDADVQPSLTDTKAFRDYAEAIYAVLTTKMTLRRIHLRLGDKTRREWSYDALSYLSDRIATKDSIPALYWREERRRTPPMPSGPTANIPDKYARARGRGVLDSGVR